MSLPISVACAVLAAVAYGAATAVEHSAATEVTGSWLRLIRSPRWLLGMGGDAVGLGLQVVALATGPVVLVQPILVLALPVSLPIAWAFGGPRPGPAEYRACAWIIGGLALFFVLLGNPGPADLLAPRRAIEAGVVIVLIGGVALLAARRGAKAVQAATFGAVAGAWFGFVAVLMDATSTAWQHDGIRVFTRAEGLVSLVILLALGGVSIALTQVAFRAGSLAASFPANLAADPVIAVILGAALLHENVSTSPGRVVGYVLCLLAVVLGAVRLARR
jgi:hypothetical protein